MLVIRQDQMDALSSALARRFEDRCVALVRTEWTAEYAHLSDAELRRAVEERIARAAAYDLRSERDLYRFVNLSCYLGFDFEQREETRWAVRLLQHPLMGPDRRLAAVLERRHER